jgi:hypothetical protein
MLDERVIRSIEFYEDDIVTWVAANYSPEYVFPVSELEAWAEANGYIKEGEHAS